MKVMLGTLRRVDCNRRLTLEHLLFVGKVSSPASFHPSRPVLGLECKRSEVSGERLWGIFKELTNGDAELFFKNCFVHNYCPLALLSETGLNITPAELKVVIIAILSYLQFECIHKRLGYRRMRIVRKHMSKTLLIFVFFTMLRRTIRKR